MTRLSVKEAADYLEVSRDVLKKMMLDGLPFGKVLEGRARRTYLIYKEFIDAWKGEGT